MHIAALAATLGGTLLIWFKSLPARRLDSAAHRRVLLYLAEKYERLFWLSLGLLALTGFGSLGAFEAALPVSTSGWVLRLALAVLGVLVFLALALLRTVMLLRLTMAGDTASARLLRLFPMLYGGAGLGLVGLVLLAVAVAGLFVAAPGA